LFHYFSPKALAYWIMCDGLSNQYSLTLCTECFTIKEVVCLINILKIRYDLNCNLHTIKSGPRIYIKAESMKRLRLFVSPYLIPF